MTHKIAAYQLSLLGDAPRPMRAYQPMVYFWRSCNVPIPPSDDELRQMEMLTRESAPPSLRAGILSDLAKRSRSNA